MTQGARKRKGGLSRFTKIYLGVLIAAVVLLIVSVFVLNAVLRDFERSQAKYVASETFEKYFTGDSSLIVASLEESGNEFESKDKVKDYVDDAMSKGEITYTEVSNGLEDQKKYAVKSGDKRIFTFTLEKDPDERSSFGFAKYKFGGIQTVGGNYTATVEAPEDYVVYVNGVEVADKYITESGKPLDVFEYLPEDVKAPVENVYTIPRLFSEPEITADDGNGVPAEVTFDEDKGVYKVALLYDEKLQEEQSAYVIEAAEAYAAYMQSDGSFRTVARYLDEDSEIYTKTRDTITAFVIDHNGYSFVNESASEFTSYDENTFSCRVKLTHKLHKRGSDDYVEYFDVIFFLHKVGDRYLIFDRFNSN